MNPQPELAESLIILLTWLITLCCCLLFGLFVSSLVKYFLSRNSLINKCLGSKH